MEYLIIYFFFQENHMTAVYIIIGVAILGLLWLVAVYNSLITSRNRTREAWSDIDVQLNRRHDLIPNLVESVKGYMRHERELLENITKARSQAVDAQEHGDTNTLAKAEQQLGYYLGNLRVAVEAYPELKATDTVRQLMDELSDTENKIQAARRFYNGMVRDFNTKIEVFPTNLLANLFHFTAYTFFEVDDVSERQNIQVQL